MWFEEISFRGFPGKLKSFGRMAVAEAAVETAAAAEMDQKQSPGYLGPSIKIRKKLFGKWFSNEDIIYDLVLVHISFAK